MFKQMGMEPMDQGLALCCPAGTFNRNDVLLWRTPSGALGAGLAELFCQCRCAGGVTTTMVVVAEWPIVSRTQDLLKCKESVFVVAVNAHNIVRHVATMHADEDRFILVPRCLEEIVS